MQYLHTLPQPLRVGLPLLSPPRPAQPRDTRWDELDPRTEIPLPPPPVERDDPADYEPLRGDVTVTLLL